MRCHIFKTLKLRDRWAEVNETWQMYSVGLGPKPLPSGILNFGSRSVRSHPEISPAERDDAPRAGWLFVEVYCLWLSMFWANKTIMVMVMMIYLSHAALDGYQVLKEEG